MDEANNLLVRHLPACLTFEEKEDLLKHFGATDVTVMGSRGKLRNCAFATFNDSVATGKALSRLHQLEVLGSRLVVEHARMTHIKFKTQEQARHGLNPKNKHNKDKDRPVPPIDSETTSSHQSSDFQLPAEPLAPQHGLTYPRARNLHYVYPPPTVDTLVNISHCLACVPRFYEQVLHLMNKMNLPPPFGPATMLPPNLAHREASLQLSPPVSPKRKQDVASDESEMSEEELKPQLLPTPVLPYQRRKKQRIVRPVFTGLPLDEQGPQVKRRKPSSGAETIFDRPRETRKVDLRLLIGATLEIAQSQSSDLALIAEEESNTGTFGTFDPPPRINEEQVEDDNDALGGGPMTDEELQNNRLPDTEFSLHSAFKNYSPGEPSSRLYVKNLSKKATEKGLRRVYSRYINPKSEEDMLRFDVRVMTEGRMKGQAFIGLPSETVATRALEETNGLKLHDRPICVQFARSAKAKQMDNRK